MAKPKSKLQFVKEHGYYRVKDMPDDEERLTSYEREYYESFADSDRRISGAAEEQSMEQSWQTETCFKDLALKIRSLTSGNTVLDAGAGLGEFVEVLNAHDFDATGIELSKLACSYANERGRHIIQSDIISFTQKTTKQWDVITLLKVLEHTAKPERIITELLRCLKPGGILVVQVPNDFSEFQAAASEHVSDDWWISIPHHLHYFNFDSLEKYLASFDLEILDRYTDFPMELFLLLGDNYIDNPDLGPKLHAKRRQLDLALADDVRMKLYSSLATAGIGRNATIFARKPE